MFNKVKMMKDRKANVWSHSSQPAYQQNGCDDFLAVQKKECKPTPQSSITPPQQPQQWNNSPAGGVGGASGVSTSLPSVSLPLDKYLEILQQFQQQQKFLEEHFDDSVISAADQPYIIRSMDIKGKQNYVKKENLSLAESIGKEEERVNSCAFEIVYMVDMLENVSKKQKAILQRNNLLLAKKLWTQCVLLSNVEQRIVIKTVNVKYMGEKEENDYVNCHVSIDQGKIIMLTDSSGLYEVRLKVDVNYTNLECLKNETSPRQVTLSIPNAVTSTLEFIIENEKCQVKVTPSLYLDQSNTTIEDRVVTKVATQLPSTQYLSILWTPEIQQKAIDLIFQKEPEEEKEKEQKVVLPVSVSSTQDSSCLIGEGVINTKSRFDYSIVNGIITSLEISINPYNLPFRIISVSGSYIKEWNMVSEEVKDDQLEEANSLTNCKKKLVVTFTREIERSYHLEVVSEADMGGTSALVRVPSLSTHNVSRETGTMAIIAKTVVEIVEKSRRFLRKIDIGELPHVHKQSGFPILMGYRFLESQHELQLDVIRHADVSVLSTNISQCTYTITHSGDKLLHKINLNCYNTFKQYLRIKLPEELNGSEVWSTLCDGATIKPGQEVKDNEKTILIPLSKKEGSTPMNIDLTFTVPSTKLASSGTLSVSLAQIDAPITELQFDLLLPDDYKYAEFEGNIDESKTGILKNTLSDSIVGLKRFAKKKSNYSATQQHKVREIIDVQNEWIDECDTSFNNYQTYNSTPVNKGQIKFTFKRFLMNEGEAIKTNVQYKEITKYWFQRRNLTGYKPSSVIIVSVAILFIALLIYYKLVKSVAKELTEGSTSN
ncbi:predicted protein [Naegleria gruberi]|uniref:Predicted protein n=1 Tax=Naegleria gruberi TaxID=5762 RepID=D2W183_NAEGR|nr:uncharacterized protein NAEGRDRAFT_75125 [Naegleria gruberi]EFC37184.1 predicted protein [Naegleria gruberi]|eukprot:XP_002669928.1 predicted protein [Naegleria gruberi strain NEG-M]